METASTFILYRITNKVNGKAYIGLTRQRMIDRWWNHIADARSGRFGTALHRAIRKYGAEQFYIEGLYDATSQEEARRVERGLIAQYGTMVPHGYNLTSGGDGTWWSLESRTKCGGLTPRRKAALAKSHALRIGAKDSETTKQKRNHSCATAWRSKIKRGETSAKFKLTIAAVADIRYLLLSGINQTEVAKIHGIRSTAVSKIFLRERWLDIAPATAIKRAAWVHKYAEMRT